VGGGGSVFRMNGLRTKEIFARVVNVKGGAIMDHETPFEWRFVAV
jgi:hypothetical protein